jgi:S-adenosylmethionine synthetase
MTALLVSASFFLALKPVRCGELGARCDRPLPMQIKEVYLMSKISADHVFTSESVSAGHPDKICDQISDSILDACLTADEKSRVAVETLVAHDLIVNAGEVTCCGWEGIDTEAIARRIVSNIGYDHERYHFWHKSFDYISRIHPQSPDIACGVTEGEGLFQEQGAGDQGMMFGYATNETPEFLPAPIAYAHRLLQHLEGMRKNKALAYLRPDAKTQISVQYKDGKPQHITTVVISHQTDEMPLDTIHKDLIAATRDLLGPTGMLRDETEFYVNPTGSFILGGPFADSGVTGRKIIVDTYGGVGSHGGGAFSGKDPSKVDRSAAYCARYAAKNIVAAGLAEKCEIQVAYAIGVAKPLSINVDTYGTGSMEDADLQKILENENFFDFRPASIINNLNLLRPDGWSYRDSSTYGHFGRDIFPWEKTDKAEALASFAKKGTKVAA